MLLHFLKPLRASQVKADDNQFFGFWYFQTMGVRQTLVKCRVHHFEQKLFIEILIFCLFKMFLGLQKLPQNVKKKQADKHAHTHQQTEASHRTKRKQ